MKMTTLLFILIGLSMGLFFGLTEVQANPISYCKNMALVDQLPRTSDNETVDNADYILVSKNRKKLYLLSQGRLVHEYKVSFGFGFKEGAKFKAGDGRTPEGKYTIAYKNPGSSYHLSLGLSYPEKKNLDLAKKLKVEPGGDIMIHGFPNNVIGNLVPEMVQQIHTLVDWTQGCIAVTDHEIEEIFSLVQEGTTVEICPLSKPRP